MSFVSDMKEYCQFDSFKADCAEGFIIIIDKAKYGRMKSGRCISGEGYIGCSTDVTSQLDAVCSGRMHCEVSVASLVDTVAPCRRDFTSYLEASYNCVPGTTLLIQLWSRYNIVNTTVFQVQHC